MVIKLGLKNLRHSLRDFGIYVITLILAVALVYMFNCLPRQLDIIELTDLIKSYLPNLNSTLDKVSLWVGAIFSLLIFYANVYFIKSRRKEIGIYLSLGISRVVVSAILMVELFSMALISIFFGLLLGFFLSQFLIIFTAQLLDATIVHYHFIFSFNAFLETALLFDFMFLLIMILNTFLVSRYKTVDLLMDRKIGEKLIRKPVFTIFIFIFGLILFGIIYKIITSYDLNDIYYQNLIVVCFMMFVATLCFYYGLSQSLLHIFKKCSFYYRSINMFSIKEMGDLINGNYISLAVLSLILMVSITVFSSVYNVINITSYGVNANSKYNLSLVINLGDKASNNSNVIDLYNTLSKDKRIEKTTMITTYQLLESDKYSTFQNYFNSKSLGYWDNFFAKNKINFLSLSDYNKINEINNLPTVSLNSNEYFTVNSQAPFSGLGSLLVDNKINLNVQNNILKPVGHFINSLDNNDFGVYVVIPDEITSSLVVNEKIINLITKTRNDEDNIMSEFESNEGGDTLYHGLLISNLVINSKNYLLQSNYMILAFSTVVALYFGLTFIIACIAVLSIQTFSFIMGNKNNYSILHKLGVSKGIIFKHIFIRTIAYYCVPLLFAAINSFIILNTSLVEFDFSAKETFISSFIMTLGIISLAYFLYLIFTYITLKNVINRNG